MKDSDQAIALLEDSLLFSGLKRGDLEPLLADFRSRHFTRDSYIFREGDPGNYLHLIAKGEVKISRTTEAGGEVVFGILGAGDMFGEMAALEENAVRSADALALADTACFVLHRQALVDFLHAHPAVMWRIITVLSGYIRRKDEAFADLAFHDIPGRVARKLLELASAQAEQVASGTPISVALSQRTLAGLVGGSRENVNRALSRFSSLGYIKLDRGHITLLDPDMLRRRSA